MKIENTGVSFQSKIKFIDSKTFKKKIKGLNPKKHEVGYPWTADTMKTGKNLYTTGIIDCIAVIIKDGGKTKLGHLATYKHRDSKQIHQKGFSIKKVKRRLLENINLDNKDLHGYIIGGFQLKPDGKDNVKQLTQIQQFFEENIIPCTILGARKDAPHIGRISLFFSNKEDTLYISNSLADKKTNIRRKPVIEIKENSIEYDTYEESKDNIDTTRKRIRKVSGTEEFFKSIFRRVSICKADTLV